MSEDFLPDVLVKEKITEEAIKQTFSISFPVSVHLCLMDVDEELIPMMPKSVSKKKVLKCRVSADVARVSATDVKEHFQEDWVMCNWVMCMCVQRFGRRPRLSAG
eukprot:GHVS01066680.1.p2 GENE.GHVS01066680.1~~GHVS01066680.1.p2  ORF type:complete len:105 (-),score=19.79 GHVS01066680.1:7-321(-)